MRKDFSKVLTTIDGDPLHDKDKDLTAGAIALSALLGNYDDEKALTGKEKADRYQLAMKINKNMKEVDLTIEQAKLVKDLVGKAFAPLVVGQFFELMEKE